MNGEQTDENYTLSNNLTSSATTTMTTTVTHDDVKALLSFQEPVIPCPPGEESQETKNQNDDAVVDTVANHTHVYMRIEFLLKTSILGFMIFIVVFWTISNYFLDMKYQPIPGHHLHQCVMNRPHVLFSSHGEVISETEFEHVHWVDLYNKYIQTNSFSMHWIEWYTRYVQRGALYVLCTCTDQLYHSNHTVIVKYDDFVTPLSLTPTKSTNIFHVRKSMKFKNTNYLLASKGAFVFETSKLFPQWYRQLLPAITSALFIGLALLYEFCFKNETLFDYSSFLNLKSWPMERQIIRIRKFIRDLSITTFVFVLVVSWMICILLHLSRTTNGIDLHNCTLHPSKTFFSPTGVPYTIPSSSVQHIRAPNVYVLYECEDVVSNGKYHVVLPQTEVLSMTFETIPVLVRQGFGIFENHKHRFANTNFLVGHRTDGDKLSSSLKESMMMESNSRIVWRILWGLFSSVCCVLIIQWILIQRQLKTVMVAIKNVPSASDEECKNRIQVLTICKMIFDKEYHKECIFLLCFAVYMCVAFSGIVF